MLDYRALIKACRELKLNPSKFGNNSLEADSHILGVYKDPFDLETINFPKKETEQVLMIGQIIFNLISQKSLFNHFNLMTAAGKEEYRRTKDIKRIMPLLIDSLDFWLTSGLKKCHSEKKLISHNGKIYEVDPGYGEMMQKMNEEMREVHKDYIRTQSSSWQGGKNVILN
jgi:hypothetical protein